METGAFAMFDALGIRAIWKKYDPDEVVRKFERIAGDARQLVDRDLGGPGHPNTKDLWNSIKMVRLGFVSDTVVIGFANKEQQHPVFTIMMAARYAGEIVRIALDLPAPWAYRGVITYGEFAIHDTGSFFVGPAVDEAAQNYERADAALIWLAPSARAQMANATPGDFQGAMTRAEYDVPLKPKEGLPTSYRTYVASPFAIGCSPAVASSVAGALLGTFDLTTPRVREKHRKTEAVLVQHLKEHAALWDETQALLRQIRWTDDAAPSR